MVQHDDRRGRVRAEGEDAPAQHVLDRRLQPRVDRGADRAVRGRGEAERAFGQMGRQEGQGEARGRHWFGHRLARHFGIDDAARRDAFQHLVARGARRGAVAVGAQPLGRARQRDQQRRLGLGEPPRLLAEIGEAGRAHPFQIAAERRQGEIEIEDLVLGQMQLELKRAAHLHQLRRQPARARLEQPRHLHGEGRGARDDTALARPLRRGAQHRQGVDAGMAREALVLVGDQHAQVERIDLGRVDRQAPRPVGRGEGAQHDAVAIGHHHRGLVETAEIEREQPIEREPGERQARNRGAAPRKPAMPAPAHRPIP